MERYRRRRGRFAPRRGREAERREDPLPGWRRLRRHDGSDDRTAPREGTGAGLLAELILDRAPPTSFAASAAKVATGNPCWGDIYKFRDCAKRAGIPEAAIIEETREKLVLYWPAVLEVAFLLEQQTLIAGQEVELLLSTATAKVNPAG